MANTPVINWRFVLLGENTSGMWVPISMLDGIAADMEFSFRMNRAAMASFSVPSEDPRVNTVWGADNKPYLTTGRRALKAYRRVGDGPGGWSLKFAGRVWSLQDQGDSDTVRTMVTCFDPLKILEKRVVRDQDGAYWKHVQWHNPETALNVPLIEESGLAGSKVIKDMVERARKFGGLGPGDTWDGNLEHAPVHIETGTFGWPGNGTFEETAPITFGADPGTYVMPSILQICDTGTVDLVSTYLDVNNGVFLRLGAKPRLGTDKFDTVVFAYAAAPYTASEYTRTQSMDQVANFVHLWGKKATGQKGVASDTDSQRDFLVMEEVENISDVYHEDLLRLLANMRIKMQAQPRDLVTVVPTPEDSARPWDDFWLGDTIGVDAASSPYPVTREMVEGVQRVYGLNITIDNDFGEYVSEMIVSPQDAQ